MLPVASVEWSDRFEPVYDLTVEGSTFFAGGVLVHNCDEVAAWGRMQETWDMLQFGMRLGEHPQCVVTTTPRPLPLVRQLVSGPWVDEGIAVVSRGSTYENKANLAASFFKTVIGTYEGTRLGRQELDADILDDVPGALWTLANLDANRLKGPPADDDFQRVVVGVDPPITSSKEADECGIIAAARGVSGRGYVLGDFSVQGESPLGWAKKVAFAVAAVKADAIVVEVNQGGEMCVSTLRQVPELARAPIKMVHASRGKVVRAEPIAALYEQNRVSHVGLFRQLEDQQIAFTTDLDRDAMGSPDRVDALVWALSDLMLQPVPDNSIGVISIPKG